MDDYLTLIKKNDIAYLKTLVNTTNVNNPDNYQQFLLIVASQSCNDNASLMRWLVKDCGASINQTSKHGRTALYEAVNYFNTNCVQELLNLGACPNTVDFMNSETPLILSVRRSTRCTELLLDYGADPTIGNTSIKHLTGMVQGRTNARLIATILMGIRKFDESFIMQINDNNIIRLIAKYIWATRFRSDWYQKN